MNPRDYTFEHDKKSQDCLFEERLLNVQLMKSKVMSKGYTKQLTDVVLVKTNDWK